MLLEIEAHGGNRSMTDDSKREIGYTVDEMAGSFPNILGNSVVWVEPLVNCDGDKGDGSFLESAES
ncbi:hypothetical protein A2U01_0084962, partial [Trifolium medium]|nr:hypothetical protein [Trifolium medium]